MKTDITDESKRVFVQYAMDAGNWSGTPLVGGNVGGSKEERGNLTQLKIAGLIETFDTVDETISHVTGKKIKQVLVWIKFTEAGKVFAKDLGIEL